MVETSILLFGNFIFVLSTSILKQLHSLLRLFLLGISEFT